MSAARSAALALAGVALACGPGEPPKQPSATVASSAVVATPRATSPAAGVSIELRAPRRARWISSTLAPTTPTLDVVLTNRSGAPVDVSDLRAHLEAVREGVPFRCSADVGPPEGTREPSTLAPGESFAFERAIDCALPLTGRYAVHVAVSFGRGAARARLPMRELTLDVSAPEDAEPRPIAAIPGLFGAIGSSPLLVGETGRGSGRIAVALVNGGSRPLRLPKVRLALRVYRAGSPIPCEDEPVTLQVPTPLGPGETHRTPIDVSCLGLDTPGQYDVVAQLRIGDPSEAVEEIGRLRIEISNDPTRRIPPLLVR